ncbi:glycoside hydrolase family 65 protein [Lactobacillus sp. CC-MHH1034]|uniref:glycoside hydrolase family 65 protein n=1 Tax=Agrilactobacillus fermenti TaxID=2586909 RepID=UPI001E3CF2BB|nr:glycoside hydrolase family 65 protein [Agrilactobacillus fermenti]MCD2255375.1 glycoside hydrolase family 65 protein [Agrilactobacillus fermenti]
MQRIFDIDPWHIRTSQFDPAQRRLQESMTSLGNGYMGMRGFFEEQYSGDSLPGIYIGGIWYPDKTRVGWWKNGYPEYFGKVINAVNFIKVEILVNGEPLDLAKDTITDFQLDLDMRQGLLTRRFTLIRNDVKLAFQFERFLSIATKELAAQRIQVTNLSQAAVHLEINSVLDADVSNEDANYGTHFWTVQELQAQATQGYLQTETIPNDFGTPQFVLGVLMANDCQGLAPQTGTDNGVSVSNRFVGELASQGQATLVKKTIVTTSRDYTREQLKTRAAELLKTVASQSFAALLAASAEQWAQRWAKSDVQISGDDAAQQGIRFNLFQLFATYYGEDARLNIGPKGFTGEKYGGATYWDTEGFALPVYLGIADPSVARHLLQYRYDQLSGAFHNAKQQGLKGALYPMVTFNGIENHNEWEITFEEIHRNGTIAYAIYNYTKYTGDETYLKAKGVDVLVAISRFWADRVHYSKRRGKYVIHGVTGPNEYENNVNNNWYTNFLAQWTLKYTLAQLPKVSAEKQTELAVSETEQAHWRDIVDRMYLGVDTETGVFIQNDDFFDKDLQPVSTIPREQRPINQHWSWDKILRSPYIKQADVLQGIWYFIDDFDTETKRKNFDFYEPLTVHESSLSPSVHAILAADLHDEAKAVEMYARTARLDLDNYNNDTDDGLHITSMTGSWLAIVQGFAGMRVRQGQLHFAPFLPQQWTGYEFRILFRGRLIQVSVTKTGSQLTLLQGEPITVDLAGKPMKLIAKEAD